MADTIAAMSALGQKRTFFKVCAMSALPPKAYIVDHEWHVRFVPKSRHDQLNASPPDTRDPPAAFATVIVAMFVSWLVVSRWNRLDHTPIKASAA
jgi:hypothetical protein